MDDVPRRRERKRNNRSPSKADVSRERVLEAAAHIFRDRGYAGTTMRSVADGAGLKAGSLYYYYPSKDLLIEAVLDIGIHGVSTTVYHAIAQLPPGSSYRERVSTAIEAHLSSVLQYGDYALTTRRVLGQVPTNIRRRHVLRRDAYGDFWVNLLQSACVAGEIRNDIDLKLARAFILGALNSTLEWYRQGGMTVEEIAGQFIRIITGGLYSNN